MRNRFSLKIFSHRLCRKNHQSFRNYGCLLSSLLILLLTCCLSGCSHNADRQLERALRLAGQNRPELEAVLKHYANDSLKLEAARFLIKNMSYHFSQKEYYLSIDGKKYRPDIASFKSKDEVERHCDSLLQCGYRMQQIKMPDITTLDSAFIVNNIELAFSVWQKPWAKNTSFSDFCRYILPYRAQIEEPSLLREEMMQRFVALLDTAKVTTPLEACTVLNKHLRQVVKYQETGLPFYPTIDETYRAGFSRCDGMCNLGIFIMRAAGIPVTVDNTTWVKMDLGHSWCVVLNDGKFHSFGPGEDNPDIHAGQLSKFRHRRPAKVYRFRFDPIEVDANPEDDGYVTVLKNPLVYDVTSEYLDKTIDIQIATDVIERRSKKLGQVYLCVHNFYEWKPIALGSCTDEGECTFKNVVGDNLFMVTDCPDGETLRYITDPFYVSPSGEIHKFTPRIQQHKTLILAKLKGKSTMPHTLHYWDVNRKYFVPLKSIESTDTTQTCNCIPDNALLWFTIPERIVNQRIFFLRNDSIKEY